MSENAIHEQEPCYPKRLPIVLNHRRETAVRACPLAYHAQMEIQYIKYGSGCCLIGGRDYQFTHNTLLVIGPDRLHSFSPNPGCVFEKYLLMFMPELAGGNRRQWQALAETWPCLRLSDREASMIEFGMQRIAAEIRQQEWKWRAMLALRLKELFLLMERISRRPSVTPAFSPLVSRIADYLERHFMEDLKVSALAGRFGYSAGHLTRLFKRCAGLSLKHYILQRRIVEAKRLLNEQEALRVDAIAATVGFPDFGLFNRAFKSIAGCTPSEYRRNSHLHA